MNEYKCLGYSLPRPLQKAITYKDVKLVGAKFALQILAKGFHYDVAPWDDIYCHGGEGAVGKSGNVVG